MISDQRNGGRTQRDVFSRFPQWTVHTPHPHARPSSVSALKRPRHVAQSGQINSGDYPPPKNTSAINNNRCCAICNDTHFVENELQGAVETHGGSIRRAKKGDKRCKSEVKRGKSTKSDA